MKKNEGFTLVELIAVITIIGIFATVTIFMVNPVKQINKAKDAQRKHDLEQMKIAIDSYYHDHGCYPPLASLPFGSSFFDPSNPMTVYMKKLPQDPQYPTSQYVYQTDGGSPCPQWHVLYAKLSERPSSSCALASLPSCLPQGYTNNWACVLSGNVDCNVIRNSLLP